MPHWLIATTPATRAAATAASTALPPSASTRAPTCAACVWPVILPLLLVTGLSCARSPVPPSETPSSVLPPSFKRSRRFSLSSIELFAGLLLDAPAHGRLLCGKRRCQCNRLGRLLIYFSWCGTSPT